MKLPRRSARWILALALTPVFVLRGAPVTRIFVEPLEKQEPSAEKLRDELIHLLKSNKQFAVAADPSDADKLLAVAGETHIKGYMARNYRLRYVNADSQPVYGGYLSLELKTKDGQPVWSYLVTPRMMGPSDIDRNLADQAVKKIKQYLEIQDAPNAHGAAKQ